MTDAWDGRPANPERSGVHWIEPGFGPSAMFTARWCANDAGGFWQWVSDDPDDPAIYAEHIKSGAWKYRGPCLTPAEIAAREQAAWRAGRDAATAWHDVQAAQAQGFADAHVSQLDHDAWQDCAESHRDYAEDIRALQPPADLAAAAATCDAVAVEREACAALADKFESDADPDAGAVIAAAIRARGRASA